MAANANKTHFPRQGGNQWTESFYKSLFAEEGITGNVFWVSSGGGTDSTGYGYSPEAPCATIGYAVATLATADNNDCVIVMPGHTEALVAAAGVAMSKAGVTVRGLGTGRQRGRVTYATSTGASFDITAARCCVKNLIFDGTGIDALTAMVNVSAADVTIQGCEFEFANATNQATLVILTTTAADRLTIDGNYFHGSIDAGTATAIRILGTDGTRVINNVIVGAFTTSLGGVENKTNAATNLLVMGNVIENKTASSNVAITYVAASTGVVANNRIGVFTGTAPIVGANTHWIGNYYANAAATAGTSL